MNSRYQCTYKDLPFNFSISQEIENLISSINDIVPIKFIHEKITPSVENIYGPDMSIAAGPDFSISCYNFEKILEGDLLHELLHLYRNANQIPFWSPSQSPLYFDSFIHYDNYIEHCWINKKIETYNIQYNPYQYLITFYTQDGIFEKIREIILEVNQKERDVNFKNKILDTSLRALELLYNCPNHSVSKKFQNLLGNPEFSIVSNTTFKLKEFLNLKGLEEREIKIEFLKLMLNSLDYPLKWQKYAFYQNGWKFEKWS
jgi:hypothetical protein